MNLKTACDMTCRVVLGMRQKQAQATKPSGAVYNHLNGAPGVVRSPAPGTRYSTSSIFEAMAGVGDSRDIPETLIDRDRVDLGAGTAGDNVKVPDSPPSHESGGYVKPI